MKIQLLMSSNRWNHQSRDEQVVNLAAEGIDNREIAHQLEIKESTVQKSLLRIYDKLRVSNRVELILYALTHRGSEQTEIARPAEPKNTGSRENNESLTQPREISRITSKVTLLGSGSGNGNQKNERAVRRVPQCLDPDQVDILGENCGCIHEN